MIDLKLTKKRLSMHWHYYRFKYVIVVVLALAAASLLITFTTPKTPANRKVDVIMLASAYNGDYTQALEQELLCALPPDQMEANLMVTPVMQGQDLYTVLAARVSAREGDIWILPSEFYRSFAEGGVFLALEDRLSEFNLPEGFDPSAARVIVQPDSEIPGEQHLCGIPLDSFTGLSPYFIPEGMVLAFPSYGTANPENAILLANRLFSMLDMNIQSLMPNGGSFGFYVAAQYVDFGAVSAWKSVIEAKVKFEPGIPGVHALPYQLGREGLAAELLASRMPNYTSGMVMVRREVFEILARQGKLAPLDDVSPRFGLPDGIDLSAGRASAVDKKGNVGGEKLYGIPLDSFTGLSEAFNPSGMVLAFPAQGNEALASAIDAAKAVLGITD